MPKIQLYQPEQNAAAPRGAVSPNLDLVTAEGRGLERAGRDISDTARAFYEKQVMLQKQIAFEDVTDKRVAFIQQYLDARNNGTLDTTKMANQLDELTSNVPEVLTTGPAQDEWTRGMTRLKGYMLTQGIKAQAKNAAYNATTSADNVISKLAVSTQTDPASYKDSIESAAEYAASNIPPKDHDAFLINAKNEISKAYVLGTANSDPEAARALLNNKDFAPAIDFKQYQALSHQVQLLQNAKAAEIDNAYVQKEKVSRSVTDDYLNKAMPDIISGKLTPSQVIKNMPAQTTAQDREKALQMSIQIQKGVQATDQGKLGDAYNAIHANASDPNAINSISQIYGLDGISPQDKQKLVKAYLSSSKGAFDKQQDSGMYKAISGKLTPPQGIQDPDLKANIQNYYQQYLKQKDQMTQDGKDTTGLTDPNSSDYFMNKVLRADIQAIMKKNADALIKSTSGQSPTVPPGTTLYIPPGMTIDEAPVEMVDKESGKSWMMNPKTKQFVKWKDQPQPQQAPDTTPGTPPDQTPAINPTPPPAVPAALAPTPDNDGGQ